MNVPFDHEPFRNLAVYVSGWFSDLCEALQRGIHHEFPIDEL